MSLGGADGEAQKDADGDGVLDSLGAIVDQDGDGNADKIDVDSDGRSDGTAVDTDGDGKPDGVGVDTDGDGIIDAVDTGGNGKPDSGGSGGARNEGSGGASAGGGGAPTSSGGQPGTGGSAGSGGAATNPGVQTLGDSCATPGSLACAGEHQKLQLLCDGEKWVQNGTCSGADVCDTGEVNRGSCQSAVAECTGQEAGHMFCTDGTLYTCTVDSLTDGPEQICESYCDAEGLACSLDQICPVETSDFYDCSGRCGGEDAPCVESGWTKCPYVDFYASSFSSSAIVRLSPAYDGCPSSYCDALSYVVLLRKYTFHVNVPEGWRGRFVARSDHAEDIDRARVCDEPEQLATGCIEYVNDEASAGTLALILASNADAPAINLDLRSGACPN